MLTYFVQQIKGARHAVNATRTSKARIDGLDRTRKEYEQQVRIFEKEMQTGQNPQTPQRRRRRRTGKEAI
jgi:hypothetical protein